MDVDDWGCGQSHDTAGRRTRETADEVFEKMKILEEGMSEFIPVGIQEIDVNKIGLLDILMSTTFGSFKVYEEVICVKILVPERNPLLYKWVLALKQVPLVKELLSPPDKLAPLLQRYRQNALKSSN